ncbi:MAG: TPM domain-containing protein [Deltaproteobacteria bacterium]|nr:TPM domain-containing protein [Deltaproteobacteria bacterium]
MSFSRALRNLITPPFVARGRFPERALDGIEAAIRAGESRHTGEVCFAVEAALDLAELWRGETARERATAVFSELRVWDTAENNGVLIYLLLAERDVEIVADRGAAARIAPDAWEQVCRAMEAHLREGRFEAGAIAGVNAVHELLAAHFPASGERANANELRDRPLVR